MADKLKATTSSKSSESGQQPRKQQQQASPARPNAREVELMTHLAENINESYKMVKQRQHKLYDLTNEVKFNRSTESSEGWQDVCNPKNKLKRKKTLSASLTSVTDSVNQEKRTRIEGIQLNCRGKLNLKETLNSTPSNNTEQTSPVSQTKQDNEKQEKLVSKPPLPPNTTKTSNSENHPPKLTTAPPPPRLKRKLQENVQTIQKLNALTEQLRLEINELKSNLTTEKGAVRVLRAQNEAETRKWKNEVKKLQNSVEFLKKNGANKKSENAPGNADIINLPHQAAVGGLVNYEIQRLTNEINALKEANKALEEKKVINCDADRRKAADIRELKDSYEIRLTQIQKSAKTEISRLLEEIKTKERNIGQLKKDLQTLQNSKKTSRNATTNNPTNKTTTLNSNKKPKNSNNSNNSNQTTKPVNAICCCNCNGIVIQSKQQHHQHPQILNKKDNTCDVKQSPIDDQKDVSNGMEFPTEISKLKNIELINNTRNVTTNLQRSTKILSTRDENDSCNINPVHKQLKALEIPEDHNDCINVINKNAEQQQQQFATLLTTTHLTNISTSSTPAPPSSSSSSSSSSVSVSSSAQQLPAPVSATTVIDASSEMSPMTSATPPAQATCDVTDHYEEQHLTQELAQHLNNTKAIQDAKQSDLHNHNHNHNHSDSDSALSSAPPSISPQPPANGVEPTDIWQTIRSYSNDIEKLQKEVESLQKENDKLQEELHVAKDHIVNIENAAMKNNNNEKYHQLLERIKYLEDQEHQLEAEANDLKEQNELLEFRILELEDSTDKWSLHSASDPAADETSHADKNVWSCAADGNQAKSDPFEMLFGSNSHRSTTNSVQPDSGIISPQSQGLNDDLIDVTHDDLCRRLGDLLKKASLEDEEKHCLQHVLHLVQQLDALTPRSGPNSLTAIQSSCEEASSSMDMVKSRNSEYSSTTSPLSSIRCSASTKSSGPSATTLTTGRIVATVQPYNSTPPTSSSSTSGNSPQIVPHNTPTDSPRKTRAHPWQSNSLSESGVFVESDFLSDSGENNACTQTDFEELSSLNGSSASHSLALNAHTRNVPVHFSHLHQVHQSQSPNLSDQKRLQFYKERLEVLEGKIQIYESSGDVQAKRLAERLQREILLEKEVKELRDRVDFLESENASLEEEKCEFEEAENDTRLRLQRLEVELEILSQRNVELEMSREALSAKYKDCHSDCLILRDDIATSETHIRHLEEDKQKAKENFEFLHNILPVLLICNTVCTLTQAPASALQTPQVSKDDMGNQMSALSPVSTGNRMHGGEMDSDMTANPESCICQERELQYLKDEVKCLRHQIKELNSRHYAAMESADSHWVDLEREYKEREEQFKAKEMCLKQKIQKLQDCLREDARSANEKICQLEEAEQGLKTCLVRVSKEHQKLLEDHQCLVCEFERFKEQHDQLKEQQRPLAEAVESEKKRNKGLIDELTFMRKLQHETENHSKAELDSVRTQMFDLKKEYLHIEVTNGELREEVATLELQVETLQQTQRDCEEKVRCLTDEIRTKDEICQKLEKRLERSEGYSLADELGDTPSKRFKREDVKDLQTASKGLGNALRHMNDCERMLPTQKQFQTVARDVKKLADTLLNGEIAEEEVSIGNQAQDIANPYDKSPEETATGAEVKTEEDEINRERMSIRVESVISKHDSPMGETEESEVSVTTFGPPLAASSPIQHQSMESIATAVKKESEEQTLVVGMALVPQMFIDDRLLPTCSHDQKKVICEVPSELRKLSKPPLPPKDPQIVASQSVDHQKKRSKRYAKRRLTRGRINTLHTRVRHIISSMNASRLFQDVSDLDICESEVLQRNFSYSSFHSFRDEITESSSKRLENKVIAVQLPELVQHSLSHSSFQSLPDDVACVSSKSVDAFTECEIKCTMIDTETETCVEKSDSSVQVDEEIQSEIRLTNAPAHIICFLTMLKTSVVKSDFDIYLFNQKLSKHWELDVEFREGLELLSTFAGFKPDHSPVEVSLNSYENFVKALSDLHSLQELFKPLTNPMPAVQDEEPSSQKSSAAEYTDKETQKTRTPSPAVTSEQSSQPTQSAATSETHLNRNNENLSTPPTTVPCPTNVPKYHQTDCANYPSIMSKVTCQPGRPTTQCQCVQASKVREPTTSYLPESCVSLNELIDSSSSASTTSNDFPIKLKLNMKTHATRAECIITPGTGSGPQTTLRPFLTPETLTETDDEYRSCSSGSSDTETPTDPCTAAKSKTRKAVRVERKDRNGAVLKLLHEVVDLIKADRRKETESTESSKDVSSLTPSSKSCDQAHLTTSSSSSKCQHRLKPQQDTYGACGALRSLLDELKEKFDSCGPCAELRTLLDAAKHKSEESQSMSDDCVKMLSKCLAKEDTTLSTSTNETLDNDCDCDCDCMEEPAEPKAADSPAPVQPIAPPCPCYCPCYYMALMASSQGVPMPIRMPEGVANFATLKCPMYPAVDVAQKEIKGNSQCDMEQPIETPECVVDGDVESAVHDVGDNKIVMRSQLETISEKSFISNDNDAGKTPTPQNPYTVENDKSEIDVRSDNKQELTPFEKYELEFRKLYGVEETPHTNDITPKKDGTGFEQPQDFSLYHIERLGSALAKNMYLGRNLFDIDEAPDGEDDYLIDDYCEEFDEDDECELGKEKRAESRKRKGDCDCCHCRETAKGKCMSVATPQQVGIEEGLNEFKYFIDSIILDLDAMEHARRKCDVIRNVCMPKPEVCSRESFPVTIIEVQDLGATSLYVKWTIHDCYGIGGYEIYVDGYLTNRYYHSRHEAAVITDVDITLPHKIALVAQPSLRDDSLKMLCGPGKNSTTKCQTKADPTKSYTTTTNLWTPSIYMYDPVESKASHALPVIKYTN